MGIIGSENMMQSKSIKRIKPHISSNNMKVDRKQPDSPKKFISNGISTGGRVVRTRIITNHGSPSQSGSFDNVFQSSSTSPNQIIKKNNSGNMTDRNRRIPGQQPSNGLGTKTISKSFDGASRHYNSGDLSGSPTQISQRNEKEIVIDDKFKTIQKVRRVIEDLKTAVGRTQRLTAITLACAEFDHCITERHNAELSLGSAKALRLLLSTTNNDDEISLICAALEMVYRASPEMVRLSFDDVGAQIVPLLLRLLERCENGTVKHADDSILNITKVLRYLSRVSELRVPLARHQGMLDALKRASTCILQPDSRIERLRVLASLSNANENKVLMLEHAGLIESILSIAVLDMEDKAREYAAASLMDLALSEQTQVPMANNDKLLSTLVKLTVMEQGAKTREYAVTTMQNLAYAKENRIRLVSHSSRTVLEALKKALSMDAVGTTRRRAAGAVANLVCSDTADEMAAHNGLVDTLSRASTQDKDDDVQRRACLALNKIASNCNCKGKIFHIILDGLIKTATSPNSSGISSVLRNKARDVSSREIMCRRPGLLETLANISSSRGYSNKDRANAIGAIMYLTNESENKTIMCNKIILNALVDALNLEGEDNTETRESAIIGMERLATEVSNRQHMVQHNGVLVAIATMVEKESKLNFQGQNSTHERLTKPKHLLMSLLLAI